MNIFCAKFASSLVKQTAMAIAEDRYPIGQQDFREIREENLLYVDKTKYIEKIIRSGSRYYFLARPRRFGKSLFLSTLGYFFEGRRELFKGLYIDSSAWDWEEYPVLYLNLNTNRYGEAKKLEGVLENHFRRWEAKYEIDFIADDYAQRLENIIIGAHEKTGRKAVILVDEYDKPLVSNLNENELFDDYRKQLASLYSNFKSSAAHIQLVFLTGVSRFSRLSVFSDLNNIKDITFSNDFADVCGITEEEMRNTFEEGIQNLAVKYRVDYESACNLLKRNYDGYRFTEDGSDIYNPWSLLNCLSQKKIMDYWNETGMPTLLAESLKRVGADLQETFDSYCTVTKLQGMDLLNPDPQALLYQTGYLTIKSYSELTDEYRLGIPNREVKNGLFNFLLPYYVKCKTETPNDAVAGIVRNFIFGNPDKALQCMQAYFAGIDFKMKIDNENNFHNAFYLLLNLLGLKTETEVHTSEGSIDIKVETPEYIYVIELKYDHSAAQALEQIRQKHYTRPYQVDTRKTYLIGVAFSSKTRCIENWEIDPKPHITS